MINQNRLKVYRSDTFRLNPGRHLKSLDEAVDYVKERGFVYFWPIKGINLPSLWTAVVGNRPVADAHDDPGHVTWGWKDQMLGGQAWYYAKVLRKKSTMISLDVAPYFYALTENYGSPEEDYLTTYEQGRMTQEARLVYEAILDEGPIDTVALRRKTHMTSKSSDSRFTRAMTALQADFKIIPVAVTESGAWRYAFAYDIVARQYPELPERARFISENQARTRLIDLYLRSVGAAQFRDIVKLFQWRSKAVEKALGDLAQDGLVNSGLRIEKLTGEWIVHSELLTV